MSIAGTRYGHGVTVHASSSVTIDLNRRCAAYDALVGVDDLTLGLGAVRFSVYGDGVRLWRSAVMRGGDPAVPVHVDLAGRETIRLVVEPHTPLRARWRWRTGRSPGSAAGWRVPGPAVTRRP